MKSWEGFRQFKWQEPAPAMHRQFLSEDLWRRKWHHSSSDWRIPCTEPGSSPGAGCFDTIKELTLPEEESWPFLPDLLQLNTWLPWSLSYPSHHPQELSSLLSTLTSCRTHNLSLEKPLRTGFQIRSPPQLPGRYHLVPMKPSTRKLHHSWIANREKIIQF